MKIANSGVFYSWVALLTIIIDQISKDVVVNNIPYQGLVNIFSWFAFTHVYNTGAAFSFLADQPGWQSYMFLAIAGIVSVVIFSYLRKISYKARYTAISLNLILGGAIGNAIDRIFHDHVIDFILVYVKDVFTYPAFNIADSAICVGVFILIIISIFSPDPRKEKEEQ